MNGRHGMFRSNLIDFAANENIKEVKRHDTFGNLRITWESYNKRNNWAQCRKCQMFGYSQVKWYNKPRCVKLRRICEEG